jgi:hypothetical protein
MFKLFCDVIIYLNEVLKLLSMRVKEETVNY